MKSSSRRVKNFFEHVQGQPHAVRVKKTLNISSKLLLLFQYRIECTVIFLDRVSLFLGFWFYLIPPHVSELGASSTNQMDSVIYSPLCYN